jgi:glycosyltransferase involved in cell wall biosynthesis
MLTLNPIVSIVCFAFNHEKYIRQVLEGFVSQQTKYSFEIIVHDDASTDNTASIIREFQNKFPKLFKPIYQTVNQASQERGRVTKLVYKAAKGKYIALCEGDDYWTDPLKLQKQVDFLEANPDYVMTAGNTTVVTKNGSTDYHTDAYTFTFNDLLKTNILGTNTCTVVFKNILNQEKFNLFATTSVGDWLLWLLLLKEGKGYFFKDNFGCYNIHSGGAWSSLTETQRVISYLDMHQYFLQIFPEYTNQIKLNKLAVLEDFKTLITNNTQQAFENSRKIIDINLFFRKLKFRVKKLFR